MGRKGYRGAPEMLPNVRDTTKAGISWGAGNKAKGNQG